MELNDDSDQEYIDLPETIRECQQCMEHTKTGDRCSRNTCQYSDKCWQHTKSAKGLSIRKSNINAANLGLFATKMFKKGDRVATYGGTDRSMKTWNKNPGYYGLAWNKDEVLDARSTQSSLGRWINDCRSSNIKKGECKGNNARFSMKRSAPRKASVKATKTIHPDEEIFVSYGRSYWRDHDKLI